MSMSNWPKNFTACDVKSIFVKLVFATLCLSGLYLYKFPHSFIVNSLEHVFSDQPSGNVTITEINYTTVFSLTDSSNISRDDGLKTNVSNSNSARNNLAQYTNKTTQVPPNSSRSLPAPTIAPVKTDPLYVTATFLGRLGNHLFIYASLLGIASAQNRTAFIRSGTELEKAFQIAHVNDKISTAGFVTVRESRHAAFEPRMMNLSRENITLYGNLQAWRYFKHVEDDIRREFTFRSTLQKQIDDVLGEVKEEFKGHVIIGVHVRRGDFLNSGNQQYGYGVANVSYFIKAFDKMRSLLNNTNVTFVVASDDLTWCRDNLNFTDVQILGPGSPVLHFGVLASCDHVILSGGTYGWWAAWLANGHAIYYDRFFVKGTRLIGGVNLQDYYPPEWIAVGD